MITKSEELKEVQDFYREMGFRLKQIRQKRKVSQLVLSDHLGVVMQTVQKYESGEVKISPDVIYRCSYIFKVPVGYFYGEDVINSNDNRVAVMITNEIIKLPSNDIKKSLYHFLKSINSIQLK